MRSLGSMMVALLAIMPIALALAANSAHAEKRIALVIGNAGYQTGALTTPANDAGLVAQTLQAAGFDVAGARDLDQDSLRRAFRDFLVIGDLYLFYVAFDLGADQGDVALDIGIIGRLQEAQHIPPVPAAAGSESEHDHRQDYEQDFAQGFPPDYGLN